MLIAQLSDIHVRPRGQLYKGVVDSNALLTQAIAHLHALDRAPDLVLISGDLVDEGQPEEYAMAAELLRTLQLPYRLMPGNHDHRAPLLAALGGSHPYLPAHGPLHYCVDDFPVRIVALDSCPPGEHHGHIDSDGLRWLQHTLSADLHKPTLVLLHHPPFERGISYLDDYRYLDAEPLAAVIRQFPNIEAVLCGHVHPDHGAALGGHRGGGVPQHGDRDRSAVGARCSAPVISGATRVFAAPVESAARTSPVKPRNRWYAGAARGAGQGVGRSQGWPPWQGLQRRPARRGAARHSRTADFSVSLD